MLWVQAPHNGAVTDENLLGRGFRSVKHKPLHMHLRMRDKRRSLQTRSCKPILRWGTTLVITNMHATSVIRASHVCAVLMIWFLSAEAVVPRAVAPGKAADEPFIGWAGETYNLGTTGCTGHRRVEAISWKPRAFLYHNFLTDEEAEHIKRLAMPTMARSAVVENNQTFIADRRTSYDTGINRYRTQTIAAIEQRISDWVMLPVVNGEQFQVMHYGIGQEYQRHIDGRTNGTYRVCTVLLYLSDVIKGGETAFPKSSSWADPSLPDKLGPFSPCAAGSVAVKPRKGNALMFWTIRSDRSGRDYSSVHMGCPVLKGEKWMATKWFHDQPYRPERFAKEQLMQGKPSPGEIDPGICEDHHTKCRHWAEAGECNRDAKYMIGTIGQAGRCRWSCNACTQCAANDVECYNENRRKAGYLVLSGT